MLWRWFTLLTLGGLSACALPPKEVRGATSVADVGRYFYGREPNAFRRVKALHDYVADRIAYDVDALETPALKDSNPEHVLAARKGVCAGYAHLLEALGQETGDKIEYVVGTLVDTGERHAINAAFLEGRWYFFDATWDAGHVKDGRFVKAYKTKYFFASPEVFGFVPEEAVWRARMDDARHDPKFFVGHLGVLFHDSGLSVTTTQGIPVDPARHFAQRKPHGFELRIVNPNDVTIGAAIFADNMRAPCAVRTRWAWLQGSESFVRCQPLSSGTQQVIVFVDSERAGTIVVEVR